MKKLLILLFLPLYSFSQIDPELQKQWRTGKEKIVYGIKALRVEGENNIEGTTNIGFEPLDAILKRIDKRAKDEMWTEEKRAQFIKTFKDSASFGQVVAYVNRTTYIAANADNFTIILQDSTGKELFRKTLEPQLAKVPVIGPMWWNILEIPINVPTGRRFSVYLVDAISAKYKKHKFNFTYF